MKVIKKLLALALVATIGVSSFGSVASAKTKKLTAKCYLETTNEYTDAAVGGYMEKSSKYTFKTGKVTTLRFILNEKSLTSDVKNLADYLYMGSVTINGFAKNYDYKKTRINVAYSNGTDSGNLGVARSVSDGGNVTLKIAKKVNGKYTDLYKFNKNKDYVLTVKIKPVDR